MANDRFRLRFPVEVGIRINQNQRELLEQEAEERGMSIAAVVRLALERQFFVARRARENGERATDRSEATA